MEDYLKSAIEIVKAQASVRAMSEDEVAAMVTKLAATIQAAAITGQSYEAGGTPTAVVMAATMEPKKAIRETSIVCLECGRTYKILTKKHLAHHGLTPAEYREKYGYKKGQPLIAKGLQRERRKKMKSMKLWEKRQKAA